MRLSLVTLGAIVALGATACGGGSSVPSGAVAVVDGTAISRSALDALMKQEKRAYASRHQQFPKTESAGYRNIERNYVIYLVTHEEVRQQAAKHGVTVSDKEVDNALDSFKKSAFAGNRTKFQQFLAKQGYTAATFRKDMQARILADKLLAKITKDVTVNRSEVIAYYRQNRSKYGGSSLERVKHSIEATLLSQKRSDAANGWVRNLPTLYKGKVAYAKGLQPPGS
jgi:SurA-like protein